MYLFALVRLAACGPAPDHPTCIDEGKLHTCQTLLPQSCNDMLAFSGLDVVFDPPADAPYDVQFNIDGAAGPVFHCVETETGFVVEEQEGVGARECSLDGFLGGPVGDDLDIRVTVDGHASQITTITPCWDVTEPNGRCCGFAFRATETIAPMP